MPALPVCRARFLQRKSKILSQLSVPDADYTDASPKGSVDEGIRELIAELNAVEGVVTTSSCAGRVSVFAEGKKTVSNSEDYGQVAGIGGKGAGGKWLFISHDPVPAGCDEWIGSLGLVDSAPRESQEHTGSDGRRLIHFKFEPMILHILTASPSHAQLLLRCALEAGFRESGAINISSQTDDLATPIVAVRSMGLGFESLIGQVVNDQGIRLVTHDQLHLLMDIATERFTENTKRIERFRNAFQQAFHELPTTPRRKGDGEEWEDAALRRERKRAEGLRRKAELGDKKNDVEQSENEQILYFGDTETQ